MTESFKSRWSVPGTENCSCLASTECTRDECRGEASGSELNHEEAFNTDSTHDITHGSLDVGRATAESPQSRGFLTLNPAGWEPFRRTSGFFPTPALSIANIQAHGVAPPSSVNVITPTLDHLGQVTVPRDTRPTNSSIDHSSRLYNVPYPFLPSVPPPHLESPSFPVQWSQNHIPTGPSALTPLQSGQDDRTALLPHPQTLTQSISNILVPTPDTYHDRLRLPADRPRSHSRVDHIETLGVEREVSPSHSSDLAHSVGGPDRDQELSGFFESSSPQFRGFLFERPAAQEEYATRASRYPRSSTSPGLGLATPFSRRVSTVSPRLPLETDIEPYRTGTEEGDGLPALLSMSDGSESEQGRPSSPDCPTEVSSQSTSEDTMTRFLHPGTPIQTELPEIQSLLHQYQTGERIPVHRLWRLAETRAPGDYLDSQVAWEDDFAGDLERAGELLDGLELVDDDLVERYQNVRGDGDDICTVCRDCLLRPNNGDRTCVEAEPVDLVAAENISTSTELPFQPPCSEMSIYAFPCTHLFHMDCLLPWLSLKTTCPTCRLDLDPHSHTLRVRSWDPALWSRSSLPSRGYVNTDDFGRRIPWQRPRARSLEEWVRRRERECPKQKGKWMSLQSPSGSDSTEGQKASHVQSPLSIENVLIRSTLSAFPERAISDHTRRPETVGGPRPGQELDPLDRTSFPGLEVSPPLRQDHSLLFSRPYPPLPLQDDSMLSRRGPIHRPNTRLNGSWSIPPPHSPEETNGSQVVSEAALSSSRGYQEQLPPNELAPFTQNSAPPTAPLLPLQQSPDISASRHATLTRALEISRNIGGLLGRTHFSLDHSISPQQESAMIRASTASNPLTTSAVPEFSGRASSHRARSDPSASPRHSHATQGATTTNLHGRISSEFITYPARRIGAARTLEDIENYDL